MNRVLKFRAWDGKQFLPLTREVAFIDDNGSLRSRIEGIVFEQFTGMIDKNGREIYEGDIIQTDGEAFLPIQWGYFSDCCVNGETWMAGDEEKSTLYDMADAERAYNHTEVVGNIHEHPELLKR